MLTEDELPAHQHDITVYEPTDGYNFVVGGDSWYGTVGSMQRPTSSVGNNEKHNNMPPYLVVYMWKRIG
jgi:hypothetical protein